MIRVWTYPIKLAIALGSRNRLESEDPGGKLQICGSLEFTRSEVEIVCSVPLRHPHSGVRFAAALFFEASPDPSVIAALKEALERERNTTQDDIPENTVVGRRSKAEVIQVLTVALRNDPEK